MEFIKNYFFDEKTGSLFFIIAGFISIVFCVICVAKKDRPLLRGLGVAIGILGVAELIVGAVVYFRTDAQILFLENLFVKDRQLFVSQEKARMSKILLNFGYFKISEIILSIAGLFMVIFSRRFKFWRGFGFGLLIQGVLLLFADSYAEKRGINYAEAIEKVAQPHPLQ